MHRQSAPPVICLMMDRLSVGMLGAYGNTWIGTPCFDRLAFGSILADQMLLTSPTLGIFTIRFGVGNQNKRFYF